MGEESFYPPYSLTLLQEKARSGQELTKDEKEALSLPYPELPQLIRDFKFRMPQVFKKRFLDEFELKKIVNYREMFTLSKLLEEGADKSTLSGFGATSEEQNYMSSRRMHKFFSFLSYAATAGSVVGFNMVYTLPLWFRSFGISWVLLGSFAMAYGTQGLFHPVVDYYRRQAITSGYSCIPQRREELLKLKASGVLSAPSFALAEFPPNPFAHQIVEEKEKMKVWKVARAKKG